MANNFVIGDIHGGLKALKQIIELQNPNKEDTLIFLGDYVDGWSEASGVIDYLIELKDKHNCIFIRGNHDVYCYNWLKSGNAPQMWLDHGGITTQKSYDLYTQQRLNDHIEFYEAMKDYHIDENHRLFIHAGYTSMHGPEKETHKATFHNDRTLWEIALATDISYTKDHPFYPKRLKHFSEIFIGHTPTINYQVNVPMHKVNVWNVDTGAAFYGKLTIMNIDTKSYLQSEPLPQLYPNEKGRNKH